MKHLKKILGWANMCYYGGLGVMFLLPQLGVAQAFGANVLGAFMMSTAICARWTMVGHHVCHGGYNAAMTEGNEIKGRFHRRKFARGPWNRIIDWMDWMMEGDLTDAGAGAVEEAASDMPGDASFRHARRHKLQT